jgi:hypothetical protein
MPRPRGLLPIIALLLPAWCHDFSLEHTLVPGGIAVIRVPADADPASDCFQHRRVLIARQQGARCQRCQAVSGTAPQDRLPRRCGSRAYREVLMACLAALTRIPPFFVVAEFQG